MSNPVIEIEHACRDCGSVAMRRPRTSMGASYSARRTYHHPNNVTCEVCGGTMDPTPKGIKQRDRHLPDGPQGGCDES